VRKATRPPALRWGAKPSCKPRRSPDTCKHVGSHSQAAGWSHRPWWKRQASEGVAPRTAPFSLWRAQAGRGLEAQHQLHVRDDKLIAELRMRELALSGDNS
jgi:hypothetical protein